MISVNHDEVDGHTANAEILIEGMKPYYKISFDKISSKFQEIQIGTGTSCKEKFCKTNFQT